MHVNFISTEFRSQNGLNGPLPLTEWILYEKTNEQGGLKPPPNHDWMGV